MNQYYVLKNGDRHGPFTRTALRGELVAGNFAGVDLVESRDGLPAGAAPYMVPLDHLLNSPPPLPLPGCGSCSDGVRTTACSEVAIGHGKACL